MPESYRKIYGGVFTRSRITQPAKGMEVQTIHDTLRPRPPVKGKAVDGRTDIGIIAQIKLGGAACLVRYADGVQIWYWLDELLPFGEVRELASKEVKERTMELT